MVLRWFYGVYTITTPTLPIFSEALQQKAWFEKSRFVGLSLISHIRIMCMYFHVFSTYDRLTFFFGFLSFFPDDGFPWTTSCYFTCATVEPGFCSLETSPGMRLHWLYLKVSYGTGSKVDDEAWDDPFQQGQTGPAILRVWNFLDVGFIKHHHLPGLWSYRFVLPSISSMRWRQAGWSGSWSCHKEREELDQGVQDRPCAYIYGEG